MPRIIDQQGSFFAIVCKMAPLPTSRTGWFSWRALFSFLLVCHPTFLCKETHHSGCFRVPALYRVHMFLSITKDPTRFGADAGGTRPLAAQGGQRTQQTKFWVVTTDCCCRKIWTRSPPTVGSFLGLGWLPLWFLLIKKWERGDFRENNVFNIVTPRKTNMEPKNGGLEDDFPFQTGDFQVPC